MEGKKGRRQFKITCCGIVSRGEFFNAVLKAQED